MLSWQGVVDGVISVMLNYTINVMTGRVRLGRNWVGKNGKFADPLKKLQYFLVLIFFFSYNISSEVGILVL